MAGSILVTGANGFVGRHLIAELGARARPLEADVTDLDAVRAEVQRQRPDALVHLAALSSAGASWIDAAETWRVNVLGTVNVVEAAGDARVIVASTGDVYGAADELPTPETAPPRPRSPYAASKAAAEIAAEHAQLAGADVVIARPFQHEGPGRDERFAVGSWAAHIARAESAGGGTVRVGDLSSRRDITDVRDVCRAYALLLDRAVPAATYNIATGRAHEMSELLDVLLSLAEAPVEVEQDPSRLRPSDVPVLCGDASKLRDATGWEPRIPLEQTLADTLHAARRATKEMASA